MSTTLGWMRDDAPYMPIATLGLLRVIVARDRAATAWWTSEVEGSRLTLSTSLDVDAIAEAVVEAALPDVSAPSWPAPKPQALGPVLLKTARPLATYRRLVADAGPSERRLLRAIATEQVLEAGGAPSRTRLLRGAKSDLSVFAPLRKARVADIAAELTSGLDFRPGSSGAALGLAPEVQTFGGTTGRTPSGVGAESALLSRLLRHGLLALPPTSAVWHGRRMVGGPLMSEPGRLCWPRWTIPCDPRELRVLFGLASIHREIPRIAELRPRGIDAVFRASTEKLSDTVQAFRWGRRVA
jgi:hypothetical protein